MVYCFWTLETHDLPSEDFEYLVLPDGCIDIVFDISVEPEFNGSLVMTPSKTAQMVTIRNNSLYAGIRLLPGAWQAAPVEVVGSSHFYDTLAGYDFVKASLLIQSSATTLVTALQSVALQMQQHGIIDASKLIKPLLDGTFNSVQDMVTLSGYSRRQLQRVLHRTVGYAPHDFVKLVRFQRALRNGKVAADLYADQSHFIRECKRITSMRPTELRTIYQLMADLSNK